MKSILTVTMNPTLDVGASVEHVFPEHKLRCQQVRHDPGGGGINVSRAIKRLGGKSTALYCCGGTTGEALRRLLDEEKLDHRPVLIEGSTRQDVTISELATGQEYRFIMPGPTLQGKEWQTVLEYLQGLEPFPNWIVASGSLPPGVPEDYYAEIANLVRKKQSDLIVDTSGVALSAAAKSGVYLIKPSLRELRLLAQAPLESEMDQEQAAMEIVKDTACRAVIVSLGPSGILLATRDGCERMRSPNVPVRSKVGAGDSTVAGITLSLARGMELRDAVRYGVATGAAAVMNPGTELCRLEDAERLYRHMTKASVGMVGCALS